MTRIVADAGPSGLGAVLVQLQGDSSRVIASRVLQGNYMCMLDKTSKNLGAFH